MYIYLFIQYEIDIEPERKNPTFLGNSNTFLYIYNKNYQNQIS